MANQLNIIIAAADKTGGAFQSAQSKLGKLEKRMKAANQSSFAFSPVQNFVRNAGRAAAIGGAITAGVAAAVAIAVGKIMSIEGAWANTVRSVSNKSLTLGIDTKQLFGIQNAAKLVGLSAEQATSGVESTTRGYYEASQGRDPQKRLIYQAHGITGQDQNGQFNSESLLEQISAAGQRVNAKHGPLARHKLFEMLDAGGIEDLLNKGPDAMKSLYGKGLAMAPTDEDIDHAKKYADAMSELDLQFDKTKQSILGGLAPALTTLLKKIQEVVSGIPGASDEVSKRLSEPYGTPHDAAATPGGRFADRVLDGLEKTGNFLRGNGGRTNADVLAMPNPNVPTAIKYFEEHGWSHAQAIGKVANGIAESSMDPRAVGDDGKAFGIFQWHADRLADFEKTTGHRFNQSTLEDQLKYSDYEMRRGNEQKSGAYLEMSKTPEEAAAVVSSMYERPAAGASAAARRADIASQLATLYPAKGAAAPTGSGADATAATPASEVNVNVKFANMPKGARTDVTSSPNVKPTVSTGSTSQFALGATY